MTRAATISGWLFTIGLISVGISHVYGLTLTTKDETGTKGPHPVTVKCDYVVVTGERLFSITMSRKRATDSGFTDIAVFRPSASTSLYAAGVTQDLRDRTTLILSGDLSGGSTSERFDRVECEDEAAYKCTAAYQTVADTSASVEAEMNLLLLAEPLTPTITPSPPTSTGYTEGQQVEFLCQGAVGKPAGDFLWFRYHDNTPTDITSLARLIPPYSSAGTCTSERISQLTLNVRRLDNGMTIRCAANHTTLTKPTGFETCNSTCRQTDTIIVFYTFSGSDPDVSSNPSGGTHTVGDTVTLKCNAVTNPPPTYIWQKEGDDNFTSSGELILSNLQIEDSGTYTCLATNVVGGATYNALKSLNINVVATTTSPPTTTSTSTQRPSPGSTDAIKPGPPDNTVVIVVCVVFGVLLIAGSVIGVIISKKRRSRNIPEEVLDERPYTTLQHEASVSQEDGVIRNDNTQGTSPSTEVLDERPYTTLQHEASVSQEDGVIRNDNTQGTCTSPSTEVLDERPYTTLQHEASVPHEYGVIRNDNRQGTSTSLSTEVLDERPYTTLQHEASVPHEYGVIRNTQGTCTSPSTDGPIYEDCLTN